MAACSSSSATTPVATWWRKSQTVRRVTMYSVMNASRAAYEPQAIAHVAS